MAASLPIAKLGGLAVKTFAKPLSKSIKNNLSQYEFTQNILVNIGQRSNTVTTYMTMWSSGFRVKHITPLEREKALKTGAEFVGEGFVLAVSAGVVINEYSRSAKKAALQNEQKRERIRETQRVLQAKLNTLDLRIKAIEDLLKKQQEIEDQKTILTQIVPVVGTEKPKYVEPPKEKLVKIDDEEDHESSASEGGSVEPSKSPDAPQTRKWWKLW